MSRVRRSLWIPWLFVGMFGVIIAVNLTMALFAFDSWTGLAVNDPYKQGLVHNRTQAAVRAQEKLGWDLGLAQVPLGHRRARLSLVMTDDRKQPVTWATVTVMLVRPVSAGADFQVRLSHQGGGRYEAVVAFPHPGLWEARYRIATAAHRLAAVKRLTVR